MTPEPVASSGFEPVISNSMTGSDPAAARIMSRPTSLIKVERFLIGTGQTQRFAVSQLNPAMTSDGRVDRIGEFVSGEWYLVFAFDSDDDSGL